MALTSCLYKLIENILNLRLIHFLESQKYFTVHQYCYRKKQSTDDTLVRLETDTLNAFAPKQHLVAAFFDIEKAYDTTWRYHNIESLHKAGLRCPLSYFIRFFLK